MQKDCSQAEQKVSANDDSKLRREVVYSVGSFEAMQNILPHATAFLILRNDVQRKAEA
jgi:hypothetical protein